MNCQICRTVHMPKELCATLVRPPWLDGAVPGELFPTPPPALVGSTVANYRIVRELGQGAMGTVYLGEHPVIGSKVAIKVLHPGLASDDATVDRFRSEARAANLAGHPNIVNIFDLQKLPGGSYCMVMEYLEGEPLAARIGQPLDPFEAVGILVQVCDALGAAHARGVIHRDLKPQNIFLCPRRGALPFAKVLDFGIAKLLGRTDGQATRSGTLLGTPHYMSPEQCASAAVDSRSDLYSLGVVAYEMLIGAPPFDGDLPTLLLAHREAPVRPAYLAAPISPRLSNAISTALAKDPAERFQSAAQMKLALLEGLCVQEAA